LTPVIGSFKSNQNTITTTTAPTSLLYSYAIITCIVGTVGWFLDVCISHYRQWLAGGCWFLLGTKNWQSRYNWNIVKSGVKYKYVVNQKLEHVDDLSFREPIGRIRVSTTTAPTSLLDSYAIITCIVGTVGWFLDVCISHYRWVTAVRLPRFKLHIQYNQRISDWNPAHGEVCSVQHYVILKFASDLREVVGFFWVHHQKTESLQIPCARKGTGLIL
jgi:hypothetical protein